MDRVIRNLIQSKTGKIKVSKFAPNNNDGQEGDIQLIKGTKTELNERLYLKVGDEWKIISLENPPNLGSERTIPSVEKIQFKDKDVLTIDSSMTVHKPLILNSTLNVSGTVTATTFSGTATTATNAIQVTSEGVVESCKIKIFQGTTPAVANTEEITHGITNGTKRIAMINVSIQTDVNPAGTAPAQSFVAPGGTFQDEALETHEYTTYYDDSKIYIYLETSATGLNANQYVCTIWYTGTDIY